MPDRRQGALLAGHLEEINERLEELDREWDIERALEANATTLALTGTLLGAFVDRRFLLLPVAVCGFLLQHSLQGWCPPITFLRRLGVRTATEIEQEHTALKKLRGDFSEHGPECPVTGRGIDGVDRDTPETARRALEAARA